MNKKIMIAFAVFALVAILSLSSCDTLKGAANKAGVGNEVSKLENNQAVKGIKNVGEAAAKVKKAFSDMSIQDERVIGEAVCLQAYATPGFGEPINNKELMIFMNCMTNAIAQNSDRPLIPYHIAVVQSENVNAFSTPGGYILITTGLIDMLDNEAQLACVIGHEIAHVAKRHAAQEIQKGKKISSLIELATSAGGLTSKGFAQNFGMFEDLVKKFSDFVSSHNFGESIEVESDIAGIQYAMDTGYNPKEMIKVLQKLEKAGKSGGTHPTAAARIAKINAHISSYKSAEGESFADIKAALVTSTGRMSRLKQWIRDYNADGKWSAR